MIGAGSASPRKPSGNSRRRRDAPPCALVRRSLRRSGRTILRARVQYSRPPRAGRSGRVSCHRPAPEVRRFGRARSAHPRNRRRARASCRHRWRSRTWSEVERRAGKRLLKLGGERRRFVTGAPERRHQNVAPGFGGGIRVEQRQLGKAHRAAAGWLLSLTPLIWRLARLVTSIRPLPWRSASCASPAICAASSRPPNGRTRTTSPSPDCIGRSAPGHQPLTASHS